MPTDPQEPLAVPPAPGVARPSYHRSKAELEKDLRVDATVEEAVQAPARPPLKVRYVECLMRGR